MRLAGGCFFIIVQAFSHLYTIPSTSWNSSLAKSAFIFFSVHLPVAWTCRANVRLSTKAQKQPLSGWLLLPRHQCSVPTYSHSVCGLREGQQVSGFQEPCWWTVLLSKPGHLGQGYELGEQLFSALALWERSLLLSPL